MKKKDYLLIETTLTNVADDLQELAEQVDTSEDTEWSEDFNKAWRIIEELKASMIYCFKIEGENED